MGSAASTAKGGFVRDALVGSFPRMATLLEEAFSKLQRETNVSTCLPLGGLSIYLGSLSSLQADRMFPNLSKRHITV
jgi:hypothetical protein